MTELWTVLPGKDGAEGVNFETLRDRDRVVGQIMLVVAKGYH